MESVWKDEPDIPDLLPHVASSLSTSNPLVDKVKENDDDFYMSSPIANEGINDLLMDKLALHTTEAKLTNQIVTDDDLKNDDDIYKSSTINDPDFSNLDDEKIFDFSSFSDSKSFIRFTYRDIPKFLDLIFNRVNSDTSSNNKNSKVPAIIVFQMLRYSYYKKQNIPLTTNFFELFINRIYLIIEDDINGTAFLSPNMDRINEDDEDEAGVVSTNNTPNPNDFNTPKLSKKQLLKTKVRKKNDIVLIAYWISVMNYLYYYLLRQEGFFNANPNFLKKIISVLNDLLNEFLNGITNRLAELIDDCVINYSSIPNLKKGLIFQNDWNFFKNNEAENSTSFQEILDTLFPPDIKQQLKPSPIKFLQVLEAIIYVFRLYNINSIILKSLLSRVLEWINSTIFNRILANKNKHGKNYLTRTFALQLKLNLSAIEDWIRNISKSLQLEDENLNPENKSNEEYYLSDDELKMIIRDYPDDLIDFKIDLKGISRFDTNERFYDKEEEERLEKIRKEQLSVKAKEAASKATAAIKKAAFSFTSKAKNAMNGTENKEEKTLKNVDPAPMVNIDDDDTEDNIEDEPSNSNEEVDFRNKKIDISNTPIIYVSNYYYGTLYSIFKNHLKILYNLLEFLQVGTTIIDSLNRSKDEKLTNPKEIEEFINISFVEFINQDICYLNLKQILYIIKNYKYEIDEPHFGKKLTKYLTKLIKEDVDGLIYTNKKELRYITYLAPGSTSKYKATGVGILGPDDDWLYLNPFVGRDFPICLPTKQELINKYGAGMRGTNHEVLIEHQPYLSINIRDMIDLIHDQKDYKENLSSSDEDDDDEGFFNNDEDEGFEMTKPSVMSNNGFDMDNSTGNYHSSIFGAAASGAERYGLGNGNNEEGVDDLGMSRPQSAKVWESKQTHKDENIEFNPW